MSKGIQEKMIGIMRKVRGVAKTQRNEQNKYSYAGHEAITEALRDAYVEFGIQRTASVTKVEILEGSTVLLYVRVRWTSTEDEYVEVDAVGLQCSVKKEKGFSPVQTAMALSYAVKTAEQKCFALTGDDTPEPAGKDGNNYDNDDGPPEDEDSAQERLQKLSEFGDAKTAADVGKVNDWFKANWETKGFRNVRGLNDQVAAARAKAYARIKAGG